jgi:nucleoside-diphosphate-sugar epimerase
MTEELAAVFVRSYSMQIVGLRFFNVYGPRQSHTGAYAAVIPQFISACRAGRAPIIFGDGAQSRDFTYVSDVAEACLCAITQTGGEGLAFNVGAGIAITVNEVARLIMDVLGFRGEIEYRTARLGEIRHSVADSRRMFQAFGWFAKTSFEDGIRRCAEFYR